MPRRIARQAGQTTVLLVAMMVVVMAGGALAIDVGSAYVLKEKCNFVLEAAALAAATQLPDTSAALAVAQQMVEVNGLEPSRLGFESPYEGDPRKLCLTYTDQQPTYFARTLGVDLFPISSRVLAMYGRPVALDYAIFSSSEFEYLDFGGATINVTGSVHGNENVRIRGATVTVSGAIQAQGVVDVRGSTVDAVHVRNNVGRIDLPVHHYTQLVTEGWTQLDGDQHWNNTTIDLSNGGVIVDGDLHVAGVTIVGSGMIVVTGNVHMAGTALSLATPQDAVAVYSLGNIRFTGTSVVSDGIFYAPNGTIDCHGVNDATINGAVIADLVDFNGVDVTVNHNPESVTVFPVLSARLTR